MIQDFSVRTMQDDESQTILQILKNLKILSKRQTYFAKLSLVIFI